MTATDLLNKILATCFTKAAATKALEDYTAQVNKALFKNKDAAAFDGLTRDNAREILEEAREKLEKTEPLIITLAIALPEEKIADLGGKIRKLFGENCLFDLNVNSSLICGAQYVYKGRMLDLSYKQKLLSSRPLLVGICSKYLN